MKFDVNLLSEKATPIEFLDDVIRMVSLFEKELSLYLFPEDSLADVHNDFLMDRLKVTRDQALKLMRILREKENGNSLEK